MIKVEVDGQNYDGFLSGSVTRSLDNFVGSFSLNLSTVPGEIFPVRRQARIRVKANGTVVLDGYVDTLDVEQDPKTHRIRITGRDKTADLTDSTVDGEFEFNPPVTVKEIAEKLISSLNVNNITVVDNANPGPFAEGQKVSAELGDSILETLETYARKRQVFLTTSPDGNLVLTRAGNARASVDLINRAQDPSQNNVKSSSASYRDDKRFNRYRLHSQGNNSALGSLGKQSGEEMAEKLGTAADNNVRKSRVLNLISERASNTEELDERAVWEANIRRARSFEYSCTVVGHTKTGNDDPWQINEIVHVVDELADVDADLLIKSVEFRSGLQEGNITNLTLVTKDAYTLEAEKKKREAQANNEGSKFKL